MFNKINEFYDYIMIFVVIYFSSSFVGISMNGTISISIIVITSLIYLLINYRKIKFSMHKVIIFTLILFLSLLTHLINSDNTYNYSIFWIALSCAFLISLAIDIDRFINVFINIIFFIAVFSLITYSLIFISPSLFSFIPVYTNSSGIEAYNSIFSVVRISTYFNSNYGLFWEPGAYQTFLNLALYFLLFYKTNKKGFKIFIIILSILTTVSTSGYIALVLQVLIYFFVKKKNKENKKITILIIFLFFIGIISVLNMPEVVLFKLFGKLTALFDQSLLTHSSYESTLARTNSIEAPLEGIIENPLLGVGFEKLSFIAREMGSMYLTATPLNWFGLFGILFGTIFTWLTWRWTIIVSHYIPIRIFACTFLFIIMFSENYNRNAFILLLLLMSLKNLERSEKYGNLTYKQL